MIITSGTPLPFPEAIAVRAVRIGIIQHVHVQAVHTPTGHYELVRPASCVDQVSGSRGYGSRAELR